MRKKENAELRQYAQDRNVKFYEIAYEMGKSYDWLSRKIRLPMSAEETTEIEKAIDAIYAREVMEWQKKQ